MRGRCCHILYQPLWPAEGRWRCLKPWMLQCASAAPGSMWCFPHGGRGHREVSRSGCCRCFLLLLFCSPMFQNCLFFPSGNQREWGGKICRINYHLLAGFFLEAPVKKLTRHDTSLRRVRKDGELAFH